MTVFEEINALFQDIPRFYTAIAEWMAVFMLLLICRPRLKKYLFALVSAGFLLVQCSFLYFTRIIGPGPLWVICMLAAFLLMLVYFSFSADENPRVSVYCGASAFIMAELAASLEWQIHTWVNFIHPMERWQRILLLGVIYGLVFAVFYQVEKSQLTEAYRGSLTWQEVATALLIVIITFSFSNISFVQKNTPFSGQILTDIFFIRTLVDMGGLLILYIFQIRVGALISEREKQAIQSTLMSQYEQYRQNQESEKMLHILQHDLKHQIEGLKAETDAEKREAWVNAMEEELNSWWLPQRTGNSVLDTILTSRIRRARTLGIRITCVADGALLSGIHVIDICTIFGNALDNAMESVVQIAEEERRLVHLSVTARGQLVFIQVSNTCESEIRQGEGKNLLTTKADSRNHGYGLKSIRYSAEKYGGDVSYEVKNGWFELRILLPRH